MTLRETHNIFIKENPEMYISLTKFGMLRPVHVKFPSQTPANVIVISPRKMGENKILQPWEDNFFNF